MAKEPSTKPKIQPHIKDLILLFAVPLSIAALAAIVFYTPRLLARPAYDFIYATCNSYSCDEGFQIDAQGKITRLGNDKDADSTDLPISLYSRYDGGRDAGQTLHYYSVRDDSSKTISYSEAQQYHMSGSSKSPDGYTLTHTDTSNGFLFWSHDNSGWYLKNGFRNKKVELTHNDNSYSSDDINLVGWVQP